LKTVKSVVSRRFNDDESLKQFQVSHFDVQNYIKDVIKEGRSEDNFNEIVKGIEEVNHEIKRYISQNRDSLMTGMQDVANLADKYQMLNSMSTKLRRNLEKLKKDVTRGNKFNHLT